MNCGQLLPGIISYVKPCKNTNESDNDSYYNWSESTKFVI